MARRVMVCGVMVGRKVDRRGWVVLGRMMLGGKVVGRKVVGRKVVGRKVLGRKVVDKKVVDRKVGRRGLGRMMLGGNVVGPALLLSLTLLLEDLQHVLFDTRLVRMASGLFPSDHFLCVDASQFVRSC